MGEPDVTTQESTANSEAAPTKLDGEVEKKGTAGKISAHFQKKAEKAQKVADAVEGEQQVPPANETVAAEKVAAEKVAAEKVAAEKVAAEKAVADKASADKIENKAAEKKAEAAKAIAAKASASKVEEEKAAAKAKSLAEELAKPVTEEETSAAVDADDDLVEMPPVAETSDVLRSSSAVKDRKAMFEQASQAKEGGPKEKGGTTRSPSRLKDRISAFEGGGENKDQDHSQAAKAATRAKSPGLRNRMSAFEGGPSPGKPPLPGGTGEKSGTVANSRAKERAAAFESGDTRSEMPVADRSRTQMTGKSPSVRERMAQMQATQDESAAKAAKPSSAIKVEVGEGLADRMASLDTELEMAEARAREKALYTGKGGSDIANTAADLESQGLGSALLAQNAAGGGGMCTTGPMSETRRTVKDEANLVMP